MEKPFLKHASVLVAAILALGICVGGYYVSNQKQYQQRVAYANAAQSNEKAELDELVQQVEELYLDDDQELLNEDTSIAEVTSLQAEVNRIKASAEDFQIEEESLPQGLKELAQEKKAVISSLTDVSDKLRTQESIDRLFDEERPNWQKSKDTAVIKDDLQNEEIEDVAEDLSFFDEDEWLELAKTYSTSASDQLQEIEKIQSKLAKYEKEELSYDQYAALSAQIEQVRNQKQYDKLEREADKLGERFNVSTADAAEESSTDTEPEENPATYEEEEQSVPTEQENTETYEEPNVPIEEENTETYDEQSVPAEQENTEAY